MRFTICLSTSTSRQANRSRSSISSIMRMCSSSRRRRRRRSSESDEQPSSYLEHHQHMLMFTIQTLLLLWMSSSMVVASSSSSSQTTRRTTTTSSIVMEMDISYTVQASAAVVVAMNNNNNNNNNTTTSSNNEWIMMDHLSLIESSMKEFIQQISSSIQEDASTISGKDSINDRITTTFSGTNNMNVFGQVHSFQTRKECFFDSTSTTTKDGGRSTNSGSSSSSSSNGTDTNQEEEEEASWWENNHHNSSSNNVCLDVNARFIIVLHHHHDDNNDNNVIFSSMMENNMKKKVGQVVELNNNKNNKVKIVNLLQQQQQQEITANTNKNQVVKVSITLSSLTFHHHHYHHHHREPSECNDDDVVVAAAAAAVVVPSQYNENPNNVTSEDPATTPTTTMRRDLGNQDFIISGDEEIHEEEEEDEEYQKENDDDNDDSDENVKDDTHHDSNSEDYNTAEDTTSASLLTLENQETTSATITPGTMAGLIVGLFAVIWLLVMICICSIYSTSNHKLNHKNAVETYFTSEPHNAEHHDHQDDDDVHPNLRHEALSGSKCSSIREEDDDDVAEEISSLVASAAIAVGNNNEEPPHSSLDHTQKRRKSSLKKQQHVEQYLATTRHHVGRSSAKQENNTAAISNGHEHSASHGSTTITTTTPWYAPPIQRQHWGDTQVLPHINWGDIFFDLFYVGAAYNLGGFLISLADDGSPQIWPRGIMYYIGMFGSLMLIWNKKTIFDSKFTVVDTIHRYSDMIRVCFLALSIMHIETFEIMSNPIKANTFNFMFGLVLEQFVTLGIQLEVAMRGIGDPTNHACHIEARNTILIQQLPQLVVYLTALGISVYSHFLGPGSIYTTTTNDHTTLEEEEEQQQQHERVLGGGTSLSGVEDRYGATSTSTTSDTTTSTMFTLTLKDAPYIILFCSYMAYQLILFIYTRFYLPSKKSLRRNIQAITTPVNVEFIIHRYGEWTMLMLGESVLSLLIVETVELRDYYIVAAAGLIMVILLQVLHFESEPSSAHESSEHGLGTHALVRNKMSSLGFYYSTHLHSFSLIALGASFKVMLQIVNYMYHSDPSLNSPESYHGHSNETKNDRDDESIYNNETLLSSNSTYSNTTNYELDEYDEGYDHLIDQNLTTTTNVTGTTNTSLSFLDLKDEHEALLDDGVTTTMEDKNEQQEDNNSTTEHVVAAAGNSKERKPQEHHIRFLRHSTTSTTDGSDHHDEFDILWKNNNNNNNADMMLFGLPSYSSFSPAKPLSPVLPPFMTEYDTTSSTNIFHHEHHHQHRSLAGGSKSTQGIDDSYEVKMVSANLFGISLMLVLISMECMSLSHRGVKEKRLQYQQQSWCTRLLACIFTLLRLGLILAAGTVSVWIWEPKWLVSSGMIIVFLSVIVKSNGRDMMLRSSRLSKTSKRSSSSKK